MGCNKIAFVFAGQGAQYPGMGQELYASFSSVKVVFDMADTLREKTSVQCFSAPAEELNQTCNTQPCLFAFDLACARLLNEKGIFADGAAGFSLGEIPAAAYTGILSDAEAFALVMERANLMHACAEKNKGMMYAVVKLPAPKIQDICAGLEQAYPVNYNCEGQTVVACAENASSALLSAITAAGGKAIKLAVSGAFHSPFMNEAADGLKAYLSDKTLTAPSIPLYANATAEPYGETDGPELLSKQVNNPVLWQKTIENMVRDGFDTFIEVGAGKTLSGLIKKIAPQVKALNVCDIKSLEETLAALQ